MRLRDAVRDAKTQLVRSEKITKVQNTIYPIHNLVKESSRSRARKVRSTRENPRVFWKQPEKVSAKARSAKVVQILERVY